MTGGGWIPSSAFNGENGQYKANFGFVADSCNGDDYIKGHFNYIDMKANPDRWPGGVKMNGEIIGAAKCFYCDEQGCDVYPECGYCYEVLGQEETNYPVYEVQVFYSSTNPKMRGEGFAFACVKDNGEGSNAEFADWAIIKVESGPFNHYYNKGPVQGNIQSHECKENED